MTHWHANTVQGLVYGVIGLANFADNREHGQNYQHGKITSFKVAALPNCTIGAIGSVNGIICSTNSIIDAIVLPLVC